MIDSYIVIDLETTGLSPQDDRIIEIGAVKVVNGEIIEKFSCLVNPEREVSSRITELTGITQEMVDNEPKWADICGKLYEFLGDYVLIGHNINFDYSFLKVNFYRMNYSFERKGIDTLKIARCLHKELPSRSLASMCNYYDIHNRAAHRALADVEVTNCLYQKFVEQHYQTTPELFEATPFQYKVKKEEPITKRQKMYLLDLLKYHKIDNVQNVEELTKSKASKMIDQIIFQYGRMQ